ncbi:MAG: GNAT family N-acetyltransferase [Prevotella sp.]|nr:GNAT family N-acetyltransferase [Prevotella sp.]MDY2633168.1 GNAT family N-acetyltransferase [Prevotella sp.]
MTKSSDEQRLPIVTLRAIEPEDLDILYRIENDREVWNVSATNVPYSKYMLHDYIANATGDIYTDKQVRMMIENQQQEVVGILDLVNFDPTHRRAEVGIIIQQPFRCQGYATAALDKVIDYARDTLHLHQLYVYIDSTQKASLATFQHVGFKKSAVLDDWLFDGENYRETIILQYLCKKARN